MIVRTKFELGEIVSSKDSRFMGKIKVIKIEIMDDNISIVYHIETNYKTVGVDENDLFLVQLVGVS